MGNNWSPWDASNTTRDRVTYDHWQKLSLCNSHGVLYSMYAFFMVILESLVRNMCMFCFFLLKTRKFICIISHDCTLLLWFCVVTTQEMLQMFEIYKARKTCLERIASVTIPKDGGKKLYGNYILILSLLSFSLCLNCFLTYASLAILPCPLVFILYVLLICMNLFLPGCFLVCLFWRIYLAIERWLAKRGVRKVAV